MEERKIKPWTADCGDGTYKNPILYADYSDPDAIRVGEDYFMVASSFCNAPGLPLLHSKDLVNWKVINYCIDRIPGSQFDEPLHGCGVWAPAIRYHDGEFIVFFPMPDEGIYVVKTRDPWGKWDEPYCLVSAKGWIDPCPFWDEDGRAYMVNAFAKSRIGFKSILQVCEMTPDCTGLIGEGVYVFDGNKEDQETIEGPKLYKRGKYYYIFAPAGGVKQGWQTVLRSESIWGPYEHRVVCMQKDTPVNGPHQGAWVDTPSAQDWFLHFQDVYAAGRIVHLQPMTWKEDWPVIGEALEEESCGKPVLMHQKPQAGQSTPGAGEDLLDDDFSDKKLKLCWQWNANPKNDFYKIEDGQLHLFAKPLQGRSIANMPNLLLQKWVLPEFRVITCLHLEDLKVGDIAGLVSLGVEYGAVGVRKNEEAYSIVLIRGKQEFCNERASSIDKIEKITDFSSENNTVFLSYLVKKEISTKWNTDGPYRFQIPSESIALGYSLDGEQFTQVSSYEAVAGRWVGVKFGCFAVNEGEKSCGCAKFDYFHYE